MTLTPGQRFGSYEIVELVGVGGMGEVYRARDARLRRDVALKLLSAERHLDADFSRRLEREAVLLASLNHPSIATLHGIETSGDVHALVMEFVDGETLAERLARIGRNGLPIDETLRIAGQIVDALDAAHERGVVHRDLKPANIKLRSDGGVKVLDFGVAKTVESEHGHSGPTVAETRVGAVIGTPSYMSPEQAAGGKVDKRADVWAFGCVLYEMLTGRRAFEGSDVSDTVASVITQDPDWRALPPNVPASLKRLLRYCLQKDPKRRLRDVAAARFAIEDAPADPDRAATVPARTSRFVPIWALVGTAMLVAGLGIGWWAFRPGPAAPVPAAEVSVAENPLARAQFTRFTDFPGSERDAAISPDGKFVVFLADRGAATDVWLSQVGTGRFTNLSQGRRLLTGDSAIRDIGITYDGSEIWLGGINPAGRMRLMPLLGGDTYDFLEGNAAHVAWSPDGTRMAYHWAQSGDPMFIADRTGADARQIFVNSGPGGHNHFPVWSLDGNWIYFVSGNFDIPDMDVWRISPSGGAPERLTTHHTDVGYPTPIDADTVLYLSLAEDGSGPWLWALDTESKTTSRASFGLEKFKSLSATVDGRRLVATISNPAAGLFGVPISDRPAEERDVTPYDVPTGRALAPRFGGEYTFYLSSLGTGDGLWRYSRDNGQVLEIWRGRDGALLSPAGVSPDGSRVAIPLRGRDGIRLTVMKNDGTGLTSVADTIDARGSASWSPDGAWLVTGGTDAEGPGLFKIPAGGGAPVRIVTGPASDPVWSPSMGDLIVYQGTNTGGLAPLLAVRPDGTPVELPTIQLRRGGERYRFLPNGEDVVYMQGASGWQDFWVLNVRSGTTKQLTQLRDTAEMRTFDIAPDGRQIVFDRLRDNADVVLIDLPR